MPVKRKELGNIDLKSKSIDLIYEALEKHQSLPIRQPKTHQPTNPPDLLTETELSRKNLLKNLKQLLNAKYILREKKTNPLTNNPHYTYRNKPEYIYGAFQDIDTKQLGLMQIPKNIVASQTDSIRR